MSFTVHPDRSRVITELHLRRMPAIMPPCRVIQLLRTIQPQEREAENGYVQNVPVSFGITQRSERHLEAQNNNGATLLWERHSEATTATIILPGAAPTPFGMTPEDSAVMQWLVDAPGVVLWATKILVLDDLEAATAVAHSDQFERRDLLSAIVEGGGQFWSDFRIHSDGYGRLLVAANGMPASDLGRALQRFQELGNYRNLALLGLLLAQERSGELAVLERELLEAVHTSAKVDEDEAATVGRLVAMATSVSRLSAVMAYRLSATAAYTEIVLQRLESLSARPVAGFQSLSDFVERRLLPATRTCASFDERLERLHSSVERATAQLRTRIELRIQTQNSEMLMSMEKSSKRQLQLQQTVEGLSVVAISYYAVGLFAYIAKGADYAWPSWNPTLLTTLATVPIFVMTWAILRARMNRFKH